MKHLKNKPFINLLVCLFIYLLHLYPPVTRKRRWRESNVGRIRTRLEVVRFRVFRLYLWLVPLNLLLVRTHQAEIIIVKRLIQGCNNAYDEGGSWT